MRVTTAAVLGVTLLTSCAVIRKSWDTPRYLVAGVTPELVAEVLPVIRARQRAAGFDSVVFDRSALPFEENVRETKEAVQALKAINPAILVEGEIGDIGTGSSVHEVAPDLMRGLTDPEKAKQFVEWTGIDILAPAVGTMHGMLKSMVEGQTKKHLDISRIAQIKSAVRIPLTLHGGSGTDDEDLRKAIASGINIVHVNTDFAWHGDVAWSRDSRATRMKLFLTRSCRAQWNR